MNNEWLPTNAKELCAALLQFGFDRWRRRAKNKKNKKLLRLSFLPVHWLSTLHYLAPYWEWSHDSMPLIHHGCHLLEHLDWSSTTADTHSAPCLFGNWLYFFDLFFLLLFKRSARAHRYRCGEAKLQRCAFLAHIFFLLLNLLLTHCGDSKQRIHNF